jgi:hypothetical protein
MSDGYRFNHCPEFKHDLRSADYRQWGLEITFCWFELFRGFQFHLGPYHFSFGWNCYHENERTS